MGAQTVLGKKKNELVDMFKVLFKAMFLKISFFQTVF